MAWLIIELLMPLKIINNPPTNLSGKKKKRKRPRVRGRNKNKFVNP